MKVAVQCESPLLQRSLERFLAPHLSTLKQCEVVVRDRPSVDDAVPSLLISNELEGALPKPFTRSQLMLALEQLVGKKQQVSEAAALAASFDDPLPAESELAAPSEFALLEKRINQLTEEYRLNVLNAVRAFYER